mmetsp:Transcript_22946/g.40948  ORF Transcript_22946/g.40948 Transcript_22946/m.40948 type:complete len:177 (+) Transcript_22946:274-804(+)
MRPWFIDTLDSNRCSNKDPPSEATLYATFGQCCSAQNMLMSVDTCDFMDICPTPSPTPSGPTPPPTPEPSTSMPTLCIQSRWYFNVELDACTNIGNASDGDPTYSTLIQCCTGNASKMGGTCRFLPSKCTPFPTKMPTSSPTSSPVSVVNMLKGLTVEDSHNPAVPVFPDMLSAFF